MEKNTGKVCSLFQMETNMKENGRKKRGMVKDHIPGLTERSMSESLKMENLTGRDHSLSLREEN